MSAPTSDARALLAPSRADPAAAWDRVATALCALHRHARRTDGEVRFVLAMGGDRTRVGVRVRAADAYGEPAVVITADLGVGTRLDPWVALSVNNALVFGALAVDDDALVVRAAALSATLAGDALELQIQRLAAEAAELSRQLARPTDATAFTHYAD